MPNAILKAKIRSSENLTIQPIDIHIPAQRARIELTRVSITAFERQSHENDPNLVEIDRRIVSAPSVTTSYS